MAAMKRVQSVDRSSMDMLLAGHTSGLNAVTFSPDNRFLATAGHDETCRVWNASNGQLLLGLEGHGGLVNSVAYSPCSRRLVTASCDASVKLWDACDGKPMATMEGHSSWVFSAVFNPSGDRIASAGGDKLVIIWDAMTGQNLLSIVAHEFGVRSVAFSPDGRWVASGGSFDKSLRIWDTQRGELVEALGGHTDGVNGLGYNHDGRRIVSAGQDKVPRIWCLQKLKPIMTLKGHKKMVLGVAVSANGRRVATVSLDNTAKIWCMDFASLKQTLVGHTGKVWSAAFSPDGKRVATVSADGTSVIWEPNSGKRLLTLAGKADVSTATGRAGSRPSSPMKRIESGGGGLIMSKEEAMGAAEIEKLRKKLRHRDEEIKILKKNIGQLGPGPLDLSLESAVQHTGQGSADTQTVEFPYELNNLDYIRRVLSNITFALRPIYKLAVEDGGCEKARDHFKGEDVEWATASSFEMVHHVKANMGYYLQGDVMLGMDEESLMKLIKWVEEARVDLADPEEAPPERMTDNYVLATMYWAKDIATFARSRFVLDNLNDLIRRFKAHSESRDLRRQAMSSKALAVRNIAIASSKSPRSPR